MRRFDRFVCAENDGQDGGWSQVNDGWHGDPPPAGWEDHDVNFENSIWQSASELGLSKTCADAGICVRDADCTSGQCTGGVRTSCS